MKRFRQDFVILKRSFLRIQENQPSLMPLGIISSVIAALHPFVNIYMSAWIVDHLIYKNFDELIRLAVVTVLLNAVIGILEAGFTHLKVIQESMFYTKQKQIMSNKIMQLDYESIESAATHEKMRRIDDMHEITGMRLEALAKIISRVTEKIVKVIAAIIMGAGCFAAVIADPSTGFDKAIGSPLFSAGFISIIALLIVADVYIVLRQGKHHFKLYEDMLPFDKIQWYYDREYLDSYRTGKEIRIFDQSKIIHKSYDKALSDYFDICKNIGKAQGRFTGLSRICSLVSQCLIYIFVSLRALAGFFGVGSIVRYVGVIRELYTGVDGIIVDIVSTRQLLRWLRPYWDFMDTEDINYKGTLPVEKRDDNEYEIEFRNVSFKYPGSDRYALKNLSMKLHIGQKMAVVGMNGSGKTTMIKLLCRLYDPTEGEITLNGIDIKKYSLSEYMSIFSIVFQDFKLFAFTLGQNISTSYEYEARLVLDAVQKSGLSNLVETSVSGLDTYIYNNFGEAGIEISGGEAQKIALARALYKNAPVIVLDEPTAALDPIAEFEIYSRFNEIVGNRTAIYISHRLSSCRFCDDIAVFHEGEMIQRGSHDTLIADESGKYYELWNAQAQYYTLVNPA